MRDFFWQYRRTKITISPRNIYIFIQFFLASKSQLVLGFPSVCDGPRYTHNVQTHFDFIDPPLRPFLKQPPSDKAKINKIEIYCRVSTRILASGFGPASDKTFTIRYSIIEDGYLRSCMREGSMK